jgi:hypothetical protein
MPRLTKRTIDAIEPLTKEYFIWGAAIDSQPKPNHWWRGGYGAHPAAGNW